MDLFLLSLLAEVKTQAAANRSPLTGVKVHFTSSLYQECGYTRDYTPGIGILASRNYYTPGIGIMASRN